MILRNRKRVALAAAALFAIPLAVTAPTTAASADKPSKPPRLSYARVCDPTGCYLSWRVVDSDNDGFSDADELAAGTDPYDPGSYPTLQVAVELASVDKLPSFAYGRGSFIAFPDELLALKERTTGTPALGIFAMPVRKDTYSRLGINLKQFDDLKLSVERDGVAIGLGKRSQTAGDPISTVITPFESHFAEFTPGETAHSPAAYGGIVRTERFWFGDTDHRVHYADGSFDNVELVPGGSVRHHVNADKSEGNTIFHQREERSGKDGTYTDDLVMVFDDKGRLISETKQKSRVHNGQSDTLIETTFYVYDEDGNLLGTIKQEAVIFNSATHTSAGQTITTCDASGSCADGINSHYDSDDDKPAGGDHGGGGDTGDDDGDDGTGHGNPENDHGYVNPDYSDDRVAAVKVSGGLTRILGANITMVRNWTPPYANGKIPENKLSGIIYVDETATAYNTVFSEPRISTAQPEILPGMPAPWLAGPPPNPDGCNGLC
ncbi:thrombospondin type 3 repeat-containing protein [Micromonospora sp. NPDC051296]|uniref:thrombospondin type 3 repeat-containing protein n=1 Tax=Micromonospora sp. NPDC051296 TaxID=3155046 RepID=UPI0034318C43